MKCKIYLYQAVHDYYTGFLARYAKREFDEYLGIDRVRIYREPLANTEEQMYEYEAQIRQSDFDLVAGFISEEFANYLLNSQTILPDNDSEFHPSLYPKKKARYLCDLEEEEEEEEEKEEKEKKDKKNTSIAIDDDEWDDDHD